ncbi:protein disulfide isomerase [Hamiltosporidium magnivora]|uniref:protein disulfide-isomerase n=1 Tax=Hamiltosporidium magnivora TaxID=148818 RepID=A0A4Q9LHL8_9MICR|nr:protein disulfide isomerase [Hamiltosporidium magnivora]
MIFFILFFTFLQTETPNIYSYKQINLDNTKDEPLKANFFDCKNTKHEKCDENNILIEHLGRTFTLKPENEKVLPSIVSLLNKYKAPPQNIKEIVENLTSLESKEDPEIVSIRSGARSFAIYFVDSNEVDKITPSTLPNISIFLSSDKKLAETLDTPFPGIYGFNASERTHYRMKPTESYLSNIYTILIPILEEVTSETIKHYELCQLPVFYIFVSQKDSESLMKDLKPIFLKYKEKAKGAVVFYKQEKTNLKHFGISEEQLPAMINLTNKKKYKQVGLTKENTENFLENYFSESLTPYEASGEVPEDNSKRNLKVIVRNDYKKYYEDIKKDIIIVFHSPYCRYCVELKPLLEKLADLYNKYASKKIVIGTIDMVDNDMPEFTIHGFPTIYLLKGKTREAILFDQQRSFNNFIEFIHQNGYNKINLNKYLDKKEKEDL